MKPSAAKERKFKLLSGTEAPRYDVEVQSNPRPRRQKKFRIIFCSRLEKNHSGNSPIILGNSSVAPNLNSGSYETLAYEQFRSAENSGRRSSATLVDTITGTRMGPLTSRGSLERS